MENLNAKLKNLIDTAERFRNAYFWSAPGNAGARRSYERQNSVPLIAWTENGHNYTAEFTVNCSCRNIYANGTYTRDGKNTTITVIRNSYRRLAEKAETKNNLQEEQ